MHVTINGMIARPQRVGDAYVWWGSDEPYPTLGVIPWHFRNRLHPEKVPSAGNGGAWYTSERAAIEDLACVVLEVLREQKKGNKQCQSTTTTT